MEKFRLKKGDKVVVRTGKSKGVKGEILKVIKDERKVVVSGANMATKHVKPSAMEAGGIKSYEKPLHISNVALVDPKTGLASKVGYKIEDGKKVRIAKKSGEVVESK